ncbi:MAG: hypothetical protein ACYTXI_28795 [Nostoc sp.]
MSTTQLETGEEEPQGKTRSYSSTAETSRIQMRELCVATGEIDLKYLDELDFVHGVTFEARKNPNKPN